MWKLLESQDAWIAHKREFLAQKLGLLAPTVSMQWGPDPESYPCLCATLIPAQTTAERRAYSAFVYIVDCHELLTAANKKIVSTETIQPPSQAQFNRWLTAQMFAVVHLLTNTGLCAPKGGLAANEAAFETLVADMLKKVDEYRQQPSEVPAYQKNLLQP